MRVKKFYWTGSCFDFNTTSGWMTFLIFASWREAFYHINYCNDNTGMLSLLHFEAFQEISDMNETALEWQKH